MSFDFPDSKWNKNDMIDFHFCSWFAAGYHEKKFTGNSDLETLQYPLCEKNKIYSCFSDSSSSERTMDLVFEVWFRNIAVSLCERNKIYSYFSDSSSSERTMDLVLEMCNTNSIHWCGISGRQLGKLHPSSSLCLALTLLSSVQGLQVCYLFSNFSI